MCSGYVDDVAAAAAAGSGGGGARHTWNAACHAFALIYTVHARNKDVHTHYSKINGYLVSW